MAPADSRRPECVLYGVGSPFVEEVHESVKRLGWSVRGVENVQTDFRPEGLLTVRADAIPSAWLDVPVLVPLVTPGHRRFAEQEALARGFRDFAVVVDPTAILPEEATVGEGTFVGAACLIGARSVLGRQVCLNRGVVIGHHSRVDDYAAFGPAAILCGLVSVGRGAFVGAGAVVCPQVTLGANSVVGAGAVVSRDVAPNTVVVGNPARVLREGVAGYNEVGVEP